MLLMSDGYLFPQRMDLVTDILLLQLVALGRHMLQSGKKIVQQCSLFIHKINCFKFRLYHYPLYAWPPSAASVFSIFSESPFLSNFEC